MQKFCIHIGIARLLESARYLAIALAMTVSLCANAAEPSHVRDLTVKTNTVGWGLALSNVAVEYQFAPRLAVELPVYFSCWNFIGHDVKFRGLVLQPELKYYLGASQDWAVGFHLGLAYYNTSFGGNYRYQTYSHDNPMGGGGFSVSYRWHFGAAQRWAVEFALGVGAYLNEYDRFPNAPCTCDPEDISHYVNLRCECQDPTFFRKAFVGIDKLAISVSYTFDFLHKR